MSHICAIKPFAFHHIGFLPDHLLWRNQADDSLQYFRPRRGFEPLFIDLTQSIAGAKDNIDNAFRTADFRKPVRKSVPSFISSRLADSENCSDIGRSNHQIEIFRVSLQTGEVAKSLPAANEKIDPISGHQVHHVLIKTQPLACVLHLLKSAPSHNSALIKNEKNKMLLYNRIDVHSIVKY